ncbi:MULTISPECIES: TonB-dependent receptor [unclassified Phenylobacterium]|uniref:TonB-dependent receptor n=1 Tax=unclassified Phenylobacterium TaxID=2640670 RepID=UPI00083B36FF|nr:MULTISPECIES: TonB-dependent receptor [unclassified Phenylobacterium]
MNIDKRRVLLCAGVALGALLGLPAHAQDRPASPQATLEEIVVTAQRRSERLQDVPVTVTAFGAEQIEDSHIVGVQDVITRTPGLSFDAFPASEPRLFIRGIGSSDRGSAGDPSAAVFLDEIYLGRPSAIAFDVFDIERIEVLKGPQGTLYGRNVVGGAINVITRAPDLSGFAGALEGTLGNYDRREIAGMINAPFAGGLAAFRLSGSIRKHDGYVRSTVTGGDLESGDTRSARAQLLFEPTDTLRIHLTADTTTDRGTGPANHVIFTTRPDRYPLSLDPDRSLATIDGRQDRDTHGLRAEVSWSLPFATLSYLGSHREVDYESYYDFDGSNGTRGIEGGDIEHSELTSHEVRLLSPLDSKASWVVGVYSYRARTDRTVVNNTLNFAGRERVAQDAKLQSYAVYGDITYPLTDRLNVVAGVRYTKDEKDYHIVHLGPQQFQTVFPLDATASASFDAVTWRLGANYRIAPDHMAYAMISRGFKSGGFQDAPSSREAAVTPFAPEYATQYELGLKQQFFDRTVTWNNSIYLIDYTDLQTGQTVGLAKLTNNAGAATIKGYETSLLWRIGAGFDLGANYAYTDATFDDFETVDDAGNPVNLAGNRLSRSPKHKLTLSPSYTLMLANGGEFRAAAEYRYESLIYDDNSNLAPEIREASEFVDANAGYTSPDGSWTFSIWGKNLTDERSRTFQVLFNSTHFVAYSAPRTYGATLRWNF